MKSRLVYVPCLGISLPLIHKAYMTRVHELPCSVTGQPGVEAHHPKGLAWGTGMGQKAPDETAIPLSRKIHADYHRMGVKTWEATYGSHEHHLRKTWRKLNYKPDDHEKHREA